MRPVSRRRMIRAAIGAATAVSLAGAGALGMTQAFASPASVQSGHGQLSVTSEPFGTAPAGPYNPSETVYRYTLTNANGVQVRILTYGGIVQSINVPDGRARADVVLGFSPCRLRQRGQPAAARRRRPVLRRDHRPLWQRHREWESTLDGKTYTLPKNNNGNTLHGGFVGFGNRVGRPPRSPATARSAWN